MFLSIQDCIIHVFVKEIFYIQCEISFIFFLLFFLSFFPFNISFDKTRIKGIIKISIEAKVTRGRGV